MVTVAVHVHVEGAWADVRQVVALAREAEDAGWDGFFLTDHLGASEPGAAGGALPVAECWIALAAVAAATQRVRIGPMVAALPRYRPWRLALQAATLDHLSGGRLVLGAGSGTREEASFAPFGKTLDRSTRAAMLDEALEIMAGLWSGAPFQFAGAHYRVEETTMLPRPAQAPRIPIWVAGTWPHRRPFRRAARWDGVFADLHGVDWLAGEIMPPQTLREIVAYVHAQRASEQPAPGALGPFDVVIGGRLPEDRTQAADTLARYGEAGLTWWVEGVLDALGTPDELRRRVRKGPPRPP